MLIGGVLSCTSANPAYESSSGGGSGSGASTLGSEGVGPSGDPAGPASATDGVTTGGGATDDSPDTTDDPSAGSTGFPAGCPMGPMEEVLCHDAFELDLPGGCDPRPVEVADLDGDGFADILVACDSGSLLRFSGGPEGPGGFESLGHAGDVPLDIAVGDLPASGPLLDIVIVNNVETNGVRVYRDNGGVYGHVDFNPGLGPTAAAIGDWDDDAGQDIAVTLTASNQVVFLLDTGLGGFEPLVPSLGVQSEPVDLEFGDFDGNGRDDLAVVSRIGDTLGVYLNMGDPVNPTQGLYMQEGGSNPNRVLVNDIEPNGTMDILTTRGGFSGLRVYRGMGNGSFPMGRPEIRPMGTQLQGIDDGDFDGNGFPDAVMLDRDGQQLFFLMLIDPPHVVTEIPRGLGGVPVDMSAGDIDGDGLTDVVVSLEGGGVEVVLSGLG